MTIAYLNGQFLPLDEIKISPMDRGFLFGDGVYEVISVYNRKPFRLSQHLRRLAHSLATIRLTIPLTDHELTSLVTKLIAHNPSKQQSIYLQCTRGPAPIREHKFPQQPQPTLFAFSTPLLSHTLAELSQGIRAITTTDIRWHRCDIKSINLLANVLLKQQALEANTQEAILLHDGFALEATSASLFIVKNHLLITPPESNLILGSITADVILEIATREHYPCQRIAITEETLRHADEIWLTSSTLDIMPVISLDNKPVNAGKPGPLWFKMIKHYQELKEKF